MSAKSRSSMRGVVAVLALIWSAACQPQGAPADAPDEKAAALAGPVAAVESVRGVLRFFDLEGGFWGIVSDAGERLRVVGPASPTWRDGARVAARIKRLPPGPSLQQWGEPIELVDLRIEAAVAEPRRE
jgi:hypothetical protein